MSPTINFSNDRVVKNHCDTNKINPVFFEVLLPFVFVPFKQFRPTFVPTLKCTLNCTYKQV